MFWWPAWWLSLDLTLQNKPVKRNVSSWCMRIALSTICALLCAIRKFPFFNEQIEKKNHLNVFYFLILTQNNKSTNKLERKPLIVNASCVKHFHMNFSNNLNVNYFGFNLKKNVVQIFKSNFRNTNLIVIIFRCSKLLRI